MEFDNLSPGEFVRCSELLADWLQELHSLCIEEEGTENPASRQSLCRQAVDCMAEIHASGLGTFFTVADWHDRIIENDPAGSSAIVEAWGYFGTDAHGTATAVLSELRDDWESALRRLWTCSQPDPETADDAGCSMSLISDAIDKANQSWTNPDQVRPLIHYEGSVLEWVRELPFGDLATLAVIARLRRERIYALRGISDIDRGSATKTESVRADTSEFFKSISNCRTPLVKELATDYFHTPGGPQAIRQANEEFKRKHWQKLGRLERERQQAFDNLTRQARRLLSNYKRQSPRGHIADTCADNE